MNNMLNKINGWARSTQVNQFFMGGFGLFLILDISRGNYVWACIDMVVIAHTGILLVRLNEGEEKDE